MTHPLQPDRRRALVITAALLSARPAAALDAGQPAPALKLPGLSGDVDLASLSGHLVYVDFWASWCTPCRVAFPFMNELLVRHQSQGLRIVAVNVDAKRADADRFLAAVPARFTIAFDPSGDTPKRWEVKAMPTSVLVGRDGKVLFVHKGFREDDRADLGTRVAAALQAK